MNDESMIRLQNLTRLGKRPSELALLMGARDSYWSDLLRGKKSFGATQARKLEEKLELPRYWMDEYQSSDSVAEMLKRDKNHAVPDQTLNISESKRLHTASPTKRIPTEMSYTPPNLHAAILLMGNLLWQLDELSRETVGSLLKALAANPDRAPDIARKAAALATVQEPVSRDKAINKALTTGAEIETGPAPLGEH